MSGFTKRLSSIVIQIKEKGMPIDTGHALVLLEYDIFPGCCLLTKVTMKF